MRALVSALLLPLFLVACKESTLDTSTPAEQELEGAPEGMVWIPGGVKGGSFLCHESYCLRLAPLRT